MNKIDFTLPEDFIISRKDIEEISDQVLDEVKKLVLNAAMHLGDPNNHPIQEKERAIELATINWINRRPEKIKNRMIEHATEAFKQYRINRMSFDKIKKYRVQKNKNFKQTNNFTGSRRASNFFFDTPINQVIGFGYKVAYSASSTTSGIDTLKIKSQRLVVGDPEVAIQAAYQKAEEVLGNILEPAKEYHIRNRIGWKQICENGAVYWTKEAGTCVIYGEIYKKWIDLGSEYSKLGFPGSDVTSTEDGIGQQCGFDWGYIFFRPNLGAFEVSQDIWMKYYQKGAERSELGYPISAETSCYDGVGRFQNFEKGAIYNHSLIGVHDIYGEVYTKWLEEGGFEGPGYPVIDTRVSSDRVGLLSQFENAVIYWHPQEGAHTIIPEIFNKWNQLGAERSFLGYPVSSKGEKELGYLIYQYFTNGCIFYNKILNTVYAVDSKTLGLWKKEGAEKSFLGYPCSDTIFGSKYDDVNMTITSFNGGVITYGEGQQGNIIEGPDKLRLVLTSQP